MDKKTLLATLKRYSSSYSFMFHAVNVSSITLCILIPPDYSILYYYVVMANLVSVISSMKVNTENLKKGFLLSNASIAVICGLLFDFCNYSDVVVACYISHALYIAMMAANISYLNYANNGGKLKEPPALKEGYAAVVLPREAVEVIEMVSIFYDIDMPAAIKYVINLGVIADRNFTSETHLAVVNSKTKEIISMIDPYER